MIATAVQDLRMAVRTLLNDRATTGVTVLTLAVAIGANTAIFSVVDGVLLRPLPYPDADRVVTVANGTRPAPGQGSTLGFSDRGYRHFVDNNRVFDGFGGYGGVGSRIALTGDGPPLQVHVGGMTPSAFEVIGMPPERGRLPAAEEGVRGGPLVALLSHSLWVSRYGSDPAIVGRNIEMNGSPWQVIGVMPDGYDFPTSEIDVWIPRYLDPESENFEAHGMSGIARLAPGITIAEAVADAERLIARYDEVGYGPTWFTDIFTGTAIVRTLQDEMVGDVRRPLWILLGTMGFVLLIACSNVANLFLVRAEARLRESAIRVALGSGRGRLIRHVLTESLLLALIGGVAGVILAYLGTRGLVSAGPASVPRLDAIGIRGPVLLYTGGISVLAGIFFGVLPALRSGSDKLLGALRDGGRGSTIARDRHRARGVLVVAQVALALVLLVGSGLMVRSFQELRAVDQGFTAEGLLTFRLAPAPFKYRTAESLAQFYDGVIDQLEDLPGVTSAGGVTWLPVSGPGPSSIARIEEFPPAADELGPRLLIRRATPGYFETMGIPVVEGRSFIADDHNERLGSMIISQSMKDQYWPAVSAVGRRIQVDGTSATSVGVVGDVHALGMDSPAEPHVYTPMLDSVGGRPGQMVMVVRSDAEPLSLVPAIRTAIASIDSDVPISDIRSMEDVVADSMSRTTFTTSLLVLAAIIALFLGSVGIYGVMSSIVSQRTSEIGVRMALGAVSEKVRRMVLTQAMTLAIVGVAIGLGAATVMGRLLTSLLYGVSPVDPLTLMGGSVLLLTVAGVAAFIPAHRASHTPPSVALRSM